MNEVPDTMKNDLASSVHDAKAGTAGDQNGSAGSGTALSDAEASTSPDLKDKVLAAIKTVYDPEIPVDVYELGLIYEISVYPVNNVYIQMTLTSPSCPSAEVIPGEIQQKIKAIDGVNDVKVDVTFDPPYSQDMMSEAAKLELGFM